MTTDRLETLRGRGLKAINRVRFGTVRIEGDTRSGSRIRCRIRSFSCWICCWSEDCCLEYIAYAFFFVNNSGFSIRRSLKAVNPHLCASKERRLYFILSWSDYASLRELLALGWYFGLFFFLISEPFSSLRPWNRLISALLLRPLQTFSPTSPSPSQAGFHLTDPPRLVVTSLTIRRIKIRDHLCPIIRWRTELKVFLSVILLPIVNIEY